MANHASSAETRIAGHVADFAAEFPQAVNDLANTGLYHTLILSQRESFQSLSQSVFGRTHLVTQWPLLRADLNPCVGATLPATGKHKVTNPEAYHTICMSQ